MSVDDDLNNDEMQQEESTVQEGQESIKDDPLNCNGVKWSVVSNVSEDTPVQPCYRAMILWDNNTEEHSPGLFQTIISYADHR